MPLCLATEQRERHTNTKKQKKAPPLKPPAGAYSVSNTATQVGFQHDKFIKLKQTVTLAGEHSSYRMVQ